MKRSIWITAALSAMVPVIIFAQSADFLSAMKDRVWQHVVQVVDSIPVRHVSPEKFESIPADEDQNSLAITRIMFELQMGSFFRRMAENPLSIAHRDAHAKGHGCVNANFQVNESLPEFLQSELFSPNSNYESVIRFSNGSSQLGPDTNPDGRGMAIKLISALVSPGLLGESQDHDFMLVNGDRFFVRNVEDYLKFQEALVAGLQAGKTDAKELLAPFILERLIRQSVAEDLDDESVAVLSKIIAANQEDPLKLASLIHESGHLNLIQQGFLLKGLIDLNRGSTPAELEALGEIQAQPARNPVDYPTYGSLAPYLLRNIAGEEFAVKYKTSPVNCQSGEKIVTDETLPPGQTMKQALFERLQSEQVCYDFEVELLNPKLSLDQKREIVENATTDWSGRTGLRKTSTSYPVARLTLETPHSLDAIEQGCEDLSFNPWRAHEDHRPLGGINRVRRFAVTGSFARRFFLNNLEQTD